MIRVSTNIVKGLAVSAFLSVCNTVDINKASFTSGTFLMTTAGGLPAVIFEVNASHICFTTKSLALFSFRDRK